MYKRQDLVTQAYASRQFITDVTEYTPYYQDILTLYRTGVSVGSDAAGSFLPDQPITRGAAAAMLTRMVDPSLRATPDWDLGKESWSALGAAMGDLVPLGTYIAAPATAAEIDESVRYMLASNQNTLVLQYPSLSVTSARRVMEAALAAVKTYCEQCYNTVNCTYSADGSITLTFSAASAGDQILTYRDAAMEAAIAVHDALWESGEITTSMSDYEKARVYFTWICDNCVYDYTAGDSSLSHIAYSLFENGTAVCDGYTGAYNLLLKLEGIHSIDDAAKLRDKIIYIHRDDIPMEEGEYLIQDLMGLKVVDIDDGHLYGELTQVSPTGANDVYHIRFADGKERLIPAIPQVVLEVDLDGGVMKIRPLEGLFDDED